jgi:hypothetical protein
MSTPTRSGRKSKHPSTHPLDEQLPDNLEDEAREARMELARLEKLETRGFKQLTEIHEGSDYFLIYGSKLVMQCRTLGEAVSAATVCKFIGSEPFMIASILTRAQPRRLASEGSAP